MVKSPSGGLDEGNNVKKGPWTPEEDEKLIGYVSRHGHGSWRALPKLAGLNRCGKSCRLRWKNYLQPNIKRGKFTEDEEKLIIHLHSVLGNKWSRIATELPGRTDNEIKNYWNTHIRKKLLQMGIDPKTHKPRTDLNYQLLNLSQLLLTTSNASQFGSFINPWINSLKLQYLADDATHQLAKFHLLQNLLQIINTTSTCSSLPSLNYSRNNTLLGFQNSLQPLFQGGSSSLDHPSNQTQLPKFFEDTSISSSLAWAINGNGFGLGQSNINGNTASNSFTTTTTTTCVDSQLTELPKLVSTTTSPDETSNIVVDINQLDSNVNNPSSSTTPAQTSSLLDGWEKLMDGDDSCLNDILNSWND